MTSTARVSRALLPPGTRNRTCSSPSNHFNIIWSQTHTSTSQHSGTILITKMSVKLTIPPSPTQQDYLATNPIVSAPIDEAACPICYDIWTAGKDDILQTHCGHVFRRECLTAWFSNEDVQSANTCPSCRAVCFPGTPMKTGNEELRERSPNADDLSFLYQAIFYGARSQQ